MRYPGLYRKVASFALGFTLFVILWGALVRITGSGAGCGSHWPTCNGDVIPTAPSTKTMVEFTHRVTVGAVTVLVLIQIVLAFIAYPRGHAARLYSVLSVLFMVTESAIGAGLVLFEYVAGNASIARGYWTGAHLTNTFLLVAVMTLAVQAGYIDRAPEDQEPSPEPERHWVDQLSRGRARALFGALGFGVLALGVTGSIAALGDTLFPAQSLTEGFQQDFAKSAHAFVALRTLHPMGAVVVALVGIGVASSFGRSAHPEIRRWSTYFAGAIVLQIGLGITNLVLLAPAVMQLLHLLAADLLWMSLVVFAVQVVRRSPPKLVGSPVRVHA